jgi:hypothetical protein
MQVQKSQQKTQYSLKTPGFKIKAFKTSDYVAKKGTKITQTSACKLTFHSAKSKIKRGIQVDLSEYYVIQSQHKSWGKIVENRNIVPDFPRRDAMATF